MIQMQIDMAKLQITMAQKQYDIQVARLAEQKDNQLKSLNARIDELTKQLPVTPQA